MTSSLATAPGKVILFGEHAVVYGRPAIAVPVSKVRAQAKLQSSDAGAGFRISAPDLQQDYLLADAALNDPLSSIIKLALDCLDQHDPPDALLSVSSTIPLGRGLGSGAALSTAIVRALSQYFGRALSSADVSNLVFEVEKLYHGTPSGIDNTVVAFEQPVFFIKGEPVYRMNVGWPFTLVIGDTGIVASTREVVRDLRRRWQVDQERYERYFDEIGKIVRRAQGIIEQAGPRTPALGQLMNENQELLEALKVSSPQLDRLIGAARNAGALGAKMSGAGWGGIMVAVAPPREEVFQQIANSLKEAGATKVIVTQVRTGPGTDT